MDGTWKQTISLASMLGVAAILAVYMPQRAAADQNDPPGRVARLKYVQGAVSFQPAGEQDWVSAVANRPMTTGDKLWADTGARAELRIGSATIRLDSSTGFSFLNLDDRTVQLQLTSGTLDIRVQRLGRNEIFEVDTPNQAFSILRPGQYRIQASEDGNSTFVTVRSGEGEATGGGQTYSVHAGERGTFTGTDHINADVVSEGGTDEFDNWGATRDRHDDGSRSTRYVSADVVGYEDLDDNGSWRNDPTYGNVWTPRVSREWAPYHDGHWAWISPWGWTWVDDAPWGYAPFHYGRWISSRGDWCWVPGPIAVEPVYAPALVAFIGASNFGVSISVGGGGYGGNVGWFPLGPREVYVPGYNSSRDYVDRVNVSNTNVSTTTITNVYNNQVTNINNTTINNNNTTINNANVNNTSNIKYVNKTVPGGVTAVPRNAFVGSQTVAKSAVAVNAQQIAAAPVSSRAIVAPTNSSVLGASAASSNHVAQPPAAIANRTVVAKATPPPPPIPFAKQQQALAVHPGQPLAQHEVQTLRTTTVAATQPLVKQAPPGKAATPGTNRPVVQPVAATPTAPANVTANKPANAPPPNAGASTAVNANQPVRTDRPPSVHQNNPASPANGPAAANSSRNGNVQPTKMPADKPANMPPASGGANTSSNPNQPMRTDRPPSAANPPVAAKLKDPRIDAYRGRPNQQQAQAQGAVPSQPTQARPAAAQADRPPVPPLQARPTPQVTAPVDRTTRATPDARAPASYPNSPAPVQRADRPAAPPVQTRPTPQVTAPVDRTTRAAPEVRAQSPYPNNPAPQPRTQPAQAPSRQVDRPPTSVFKVDKSPIDTNAASQRGQASRTQAIQPQPRPQPQPQPQAKPIPRAENQPPNKPARPSPEKRQ